MQAIPQQIPEQLKGWQFILISPKRKIPVSEMKGWADNRGEITLTSDSPKLIQHLLDGGNYGVCADKDRFIVAADTKDIEKAIEERLPATFTIKSPRHKTKHFYFYGEITRTIQCKPTPEGDPCADIRCGNSYVLGPGSTFDKYGSYEITDNRPIATCTESELIAAINEFIKTVKEPLALDDYENKDINPETTFPITKLLTNFDGLSRNGDEICGPHPVHGSTTGANFRVNVKKNVWHCFRAGHDSGGGPLELLAVIEGIISCEEAKKGALRGEKFMKVMEKAAEKGLIKTVPKTLGSELTKAKTVNGENQLTPDAERILNYFYEKYIFKTSDDTEDIYIYQDGVYKPAETAIKKELEDKLGALINTYFVNEVLYHIKRKTVVPRSDFNRSGKYLPCQNGLLNLQTLELEGFTPDKIFTFKINASYDKSKDCPKFKAFITQILDEENAKCLQEFMGYSLFPALPYHKMAFLYGEGRNGKDRIAMTVRALLGEENCSNVTLEELNGEARFAPARLYGKLVNFCTEPMTNRTLNTPLLKKITGESPVDGEIKNKQNPIRFTSFAKLYVLGNKFPKVKDVTLSFWDRLIMIPFEHTFTGDKQIPNIERQWTESQDEMSGILNWLIEGLWRLHQNGRFTTDKKMDDLMLEFRRQSDPSAAYMQEQCEFDSSTFTKRKTLFEDYKTYAQSIDIVPEKDSIFYSKVRQLPGVREEQKRIGEKVERVFLGIKIKNKNEQLPIDDANKSNTVLDTVIAAKPIEQSEGSSSKNVATESHESPLYNSMKKGQESSFTKEYQTPASCDSAATKQPVEKARSASNTCSKCGHPFGNEQVNSPFWKGLVCRTCADELKGDY